jgi:siroheme synthase
MGVGKADAISLELIRHGRAAATPVAIIENGTTENEKIVKGRLADLGDLVRDKHINGPALLVIGEVAAMATGALVENAAAAWRAA